MTPNPKMLKKAIAAARQLSNCVETLNLFLAGTPDEIQAQLEALNVREIGTREVPA